MCGCTETKVSTSITKLIDLGYIQQTKFDGRKRYLKSNLRYEIKKQTLNNLKADFNEPKKQTLNNLKEDFKSKNIFYILFCLFCIFIFIVT